ncbi:MAG: hypothetical protein ACK5LT_10810 [Lachnospirales bacterium]
MSKQIKILAFGGCNEITAVGAAKQRKRNTFMFFPKGQNASKQLKLFIVEF